MAAAKTTKVTAFTRRRPSRKPFPAHLPRERVVVPGPTACACCGGARLSKLGEDITETLEVIPRQWKVIQHVREKFTCRDCEKISQAPAPFHVIAARLGRAKPAGDDPVREVRPASAAQPPGRALCQGGRAAQPVDLGRPGRRLRRSADADVQAPRGARPGRRAIAWRRHHGAGPGQGQDRHRPIMGLCARRQAVRRAGAAGGSVLLLARPGRRASPGHLATYSGILQADAYGGYGKLYEPGRSPGPILEAACWVHARRKFFVLADLAESARRKAQGKTPAVDLAAGAGSGPPDRRPVRHRARRSTACAPTGARPSARNSARRWSPNWRPGCASERAKLSRDNDVAKAMDYMLKRWTAFTRFLDDGRICLSNNAAERALRGIALGRKAWLFAGSDRGGERAAVMYTLIVHRQAQRRRSAGLARRRARPHRRASRPQARRAAALELGRRDGAS